MKNNLFLRILCLTVTVLLLHTQIELYAICGETTTGGGGGTTTGGSTSTGNPNLISNRDKGMDKASEKALEALKEKQEIDWVEADFLGKIKGTKTDRGLEKAIKSLKEFKEVEYNARCPILVFFESKKTYSKGASGKIRLTKSATESAKIDQGVFESSLPIRLASRFFLCLRIDITNIDLDSEKELITGENAPIVVILNEKGNIKGNFQGKDCTEAKIYRSMAGVTKENKVDLTKVVKTLEKFHRTKLMDIERKLYTARRKAHDISDHLIKHHGHKYKKGFEATKKQLNEALAVCKDLEAQKYKCLLYEYSILRKAGAPVEKPIPFKN